MTTCSNPSRPKRAIGRRVAVGATTVGLALAPVLVASPASAAGFGSGNVVVCRVGSGVATGVGSLVNTGSPVFLDEFTPAGTLVQSIAMPTTASGANKPLIASGTATSECLVTRSDDGQYLIVTGYGSTIPAASSLTSSASTTVNRVIGRVDAAGNVDTSTALTDAATGNNPRSATSSNGTDFWIAGGAGGVRKTTLGSTGSTDLTTAATFTNVRQLNIFGGQLYASSGSGTNTFRGVETVGSGLPVAASAVTRFAGLTDTITPSSYGFVLADLSSSVAGPDTLYLADDTLGIQKFSLVGTNWVLNNTLGTGADAYRGLTAVTNGSTVTLYATRKGGTAAAGGGELVSLTDTAGYNVSNNGTIALRSTAATNTAYRGVALAPVNVPTPVVPEVPLAVVLPVSMILAIGGFVLTRHRPSLRVGA